MSSRNSAVDQSEIGAEDLESKFLIGQIAWVLIWWAMVMVAFILLTPVEIVTPRSNFSEVLNAVVPAYAAVMVWMYGGMHVTPAYKLYQGAQAYLKFTPTYQHVERPDLLADGVKALYGTLRLGVPLGVGAMGSILIVGYNEAYVALRSSGTVAGPLNDLVYASAFGVTSLSLLLLIGVFSITWLYMLPENPNQIHTRDAFGTLVVKHE